MVRLWLSLRRIRQRATPRSSERREIEAYLRQHDAFEDVRAVSSWVRVFSGVMAAVLVLCVGVSSYAYASEAVLPNTVLYPVREAIEQVEVALAVTPVQKEKVEKKLEVRRAKEVEKLTELKRPVPAPLKKYIGAGVTTTTKSVLKKAQQEKKVEQAEKREERQEEARKKAEERLQSRFRLPQTQVREQKQHERQVLLEQRRSHLEKRTQERQKQQETARDRQRTRTERGR